LEHFLSEKRLKFGPWQALERGLARLLEHGGFKDVKIVGGSGDLGADVLAIKGNERWLVQSKYRSNEGAIGKKAVQEAFRAMQAYGADKCITATNQYFSEDAKKYNLQKINLGFDSRLWDKFTILKFAEKRDLRSANFRKPHDYQQLAIDKVLSEIKNGGSKGLLTIATGLGKTLIATTIISEYLAENPHSKILVLAHMRDLVKQLDIASWSQLDLDTHTHIWTEKEKPKFFDGVLFATWQSILIALKNGEIKPADFDLIVVDECHHAASKSFSYLLKELNPLFLLGVTATPWRSDKNSLRPLFGDPIYSMSVVEGMSKGFLAEVDYEMLIDDIDWDDISYRSKNGYTIRDLNQRLYVPERDASMVAEIISIIEKTENPRVLVFCRSIRHAERLLNFFRTYDITTAILHSGLSRTERFKSLSNFRIGKVSVLISIEMLNEGIDVPEVNIVCFARVTHSRRIFLQQLGRGLRLSKGKSKVKVLDFVADIRRVAEGIEMNKEAIRISEEENYYLNRQIIKFSSEVKPYFKQYLEDMADISNLDDNATLEFPDDY